MIERDNTIRLWLCLLPEPFRSQALNNCTTHDNTRLSKRVKSLAQALSSGFLWHKSPEGLEYWMILHKRAEKGEFQE